MKLEAFPNNLLFLPSLKFSGAQDRQVSFDKRWTGPTPLKSFYESVVNSLNGLLNFHL